jgi:hypothetical protein
MTAHIENYNHRLSKDQLITVGDLVEFKSELLTEISKLLQRAQLGMSQPKAWLKSREVRELLKVSGGKLLTMRVNGTLPYTRVGGVIYYEYKDIEHMLEKLKFNKASHIPELRDKLNGQ